MFKKFVSSVKHLKRRRKKDKGDASSPVSISPSGESEQEAPAQARLTRKFTVNVEEAISEVADSSEHQLSSGDHEVASNNVAPDVANRLQPTPTVQKPIPLPYAADSVCGGRYSNEDAYAVLPNFISLPANTLVCPPECSGCQSRQVDTPNDLDQHNTPAHHAASNGTPPSELVHFFGVFDGHGGSAAAEHCAEKMHTYLLEYMSSLTPQPPADHQSNSNSMEGVQSPSENGIAHSQCRMHDVLTATFLRTHKEFIDRSKLNYVGSTAVAALVSDANMWVANCGDSRAVLCRSGAAVALSQDHKPTRQDEAARVQAAGGHVLWDRVMGELAVSRAIGDEFLRPYVIADPEVIHLPRTREDDFIVMATDGLWDVFTSQEACDVASRQVRKGWAEGVSHARQAARYLIREALMRSTRDNVTVVVVDLKLMKAHIEGGKPGTGGCAMQGFRV